MYRPPVVPSVTVMEKFTFVLGFLRWDAHAVDASRNNVVDLLLNWVVPIAVIWAMVKFTATYPDRVTRPTGSQAGGVRPAGGATA